MRVIVGRVGRPHGLGGEVSIWVRTDEPDLRFAVGAVVDADRDLPQGGPGGAGSPRVRGGAEGVWGERLPPKSRGGLGGIVPPEATVRLTVASARWHSGQLLVAFAGVTDRDAAGQLTGSWLSVDSSELPETTDPDEFRDHELIGLSVRTAAGERVGEVTDVLHHGQDLLVVRCAGPGNGECLVPFVKAIVPEVDLAAGVLVIDPPRGLLDPAEAEEARE
jgi:16S rRNA processing protein RimM